MNIFIKIAVFSGLVFSPSQAVEEDDFSSFFLRSLSPVESQVTESFERGERPFCLFPLPDVSHLVMEAITKWDIEDETTQSVGNWRMEGFVPTKWLTEKSLDKQGCPLNLETIFQSSQSNFFHDVSYEASFDNASEDLGEFPPPPNTSDLMIQFLWKTCNVFTIADAAVLSSSSPQRVVKQKKTKKKEHKKIAKKEKNNFTTQKSRKKQEKSTPQPSPIYSAPIYQVEKWELNGKKKYTIARW